MNSAGMTEEQWRGYMTRAIEDIGKDIGEIKKEQEVCNDIILQIKDDQGNMKKTAGKISGTIAVVVSVLGTLLASFIRHLLGSK